MSKSSKGGEFERYVCKFLTTYMGGDPKKPYLWRTPGSGSRCTIHGDENMSGDIIAIREEGKAICSYLSVECKTGYDDMSLDKFLKENKSDPLKAFWDQCIRDSTESGKMPMVIYRKKGLPSPWVCIDDKLFKKLKTNTLGMRYIFLNWNNELPDMYIFEMNTFFEVITFDIMKKALKCK